MFCKQCEKETAGKNGFCLYCGEKFEKTKSRIPEYDLWENEKPVKNNKKRLILLGSAFALVMMLIFLIPMIDIDNQGYFRDTKWGMSMEQVRSSEKAEFIAATPDALFYEIDNLPGFEGKKTGVTYDFDAHGELMHGYYLLSFSESDINGKTLMNKLATGYEKIYGKDYATEDDSFTWFTDKSYIRIFYADEGGIIITFQSL